MGRVVMGRVSVVIPTFNEVAAIAEVIGELPNDLVAEVAEEIGVAMANLVNLFNPSMIELCPT